MGKGATVKKLDTGTGRSPTFPCHHRRPFFRCKYTNNRQKPNLHKAFFFDLEKTFFATAAPIPSHLPHRTGQTGNGPEGVKRHREAFSRKITERFRKDSRFFLPPCAGYRQEKHIFAQFRLTLGCHACPHPAPPHLRTNSFSHSPLPHHT